MPVKFHLTDDDVDERELFIEAVNAVDPDIICDTFSKARDMLSKLEAEENQKPDLIFLDINLPQMNGWDCLKILKASVTLKDIPVLMYSTSSHERERIIASDLGAVGLITKPTNFEDLKKKLHAICQAVESKNFSEIGSMR